MERVVVMVVVGGWQRGRQRGRRRRWRRGGAEGGSNGGGVRRRRKGRGELAPRCEEEITPAVSAIARTWLSL